MLSARKTVSKRTLHEEHSSKTFELRLVLVIYIMNYVYMVKKISLETLECYEKWT